MKWRYEERKREETRKLGSVISKQREREREKQNAREEEKQGKLDSIAIEARPRHTGTSIDESSK